MGRLISNRPLLSLPQEDDSIIRGAAILRTQLHDRGSLMDDGLESTASSDDQAPPAVASETTGSGTSRSSLNSHPLHHPEDDADNFSDPWASSKRAMPPKHGGPRVVTPTRQDDVSFGFDSSLSGNGTFSNSSGRQVEWANQAMGEDGSEALSVRSALSARSRQPDTDDTDPLSPRRSKRRDVGVTQVTTYNLVGPIVSNEDDSDEKLGYSFVDDEDDDASDRGGPSYLPREMRKSRPSSRKQQQQQQYQPPPQPTKSSNPPNRKARILQLVTGNSPDRVPKTTQPQKGTKSRFGGDSQGAMESFLDKVVSPLSVNYTMLMQDPAFCHAQNAGLLWQSLVGSQIRFPSSWWNGERSPPMGLDGKKRPWQFFGRYPSFNPSLRRYVKHRSSPGRLLLHIVVQDLVTWKPVQDIVVGCFDPNSRGIRRTSKAEAGNEDCRELFLAVRKRSDTISVIDSLLAQGRSWLDCECKGPLGPKQRITNTNVRAVFGEEAPVETIFIHESTLYERLIAGKDQGPPIFLVKEFVFC